MKKDLHPAYFPSATVKCACGNTFTVGSIIETLEVEICSACHPFYTGQGKIVDKLGQVQKFKERLAKKKPVSDKPARLAGKTKAKKSASPKKTTRTKPASVPTARQEK